MSNVKSRLPLVDRLLHISKIISNNILTLVCSWLCKSFCHVAVGLIAVSNVKSRLPLVDRLLHISKRISVNTKMLV